jgi:hypothetical protein
MAEHNSVCVAGWSDKQKLGLVRAFWEARPPAMFFDVSGLPVPEWDEAEAVYYYSRGYVDYTSGRRLKLATRGDNWDLRAYDCDIPSSLKPGREVYAAYVASLKPKP